MQVRGDLLTGRHDIAHIGILGFSQRRGNTDVHRVQVGDRSEVTGSTEAAGFYKPAQIVARNILDIRITQVHSSDLGLLEVNSGDGKAGFRELHSERQPDIAETDDADASRTGP